MTLLNYTVDSLASQIFFHELSIKSGKGKEQKHDPIFFPHFPLHFTIWFYLQIVVRRKFKPLT